MNVMLDLETLGSGANAAITQIGAVEFDPATETLGRAFFAQIGIENAMKEGDVDGATLVWWMKQPDAARADMCKAGWPMQEALRAFARWLGADAQVWGNGAAFDNAILASAYRRAGLEQPWKFWNDRCYRTLKAIWGHPAQTFTPQRLHAMGLHTNVPLNQAHHAAYDAAQQAANAVYILRRLQWVS